MNHTKAINLMAENMRIMGRLSSRLQSLLETNSNNSRQQMSVLVRLYLAGKIKLKDFANREVISTANLCSIFKKLEQDKLVIRSVDENDHRDTWYEVTKSGKVLAEKLMDNFMQGLESLCKVLPQEDAEKLAKTVETINELLKKIEVLNA